MVESGGYLDYLNFALPLWLLSGILILQLDVKHYEHVSMNKEKKVAKFIGWLNLWLSLIVIIGNWAIERWIWR